jgi:phage terminase large subunit GpA-like protein
VILKAKNQPINSGSVFGRFREFAAGCWRPLTILPPAEWAEQNVWLTEEFEASRGRFDLDDRPWWRDVLDALNDVTTLGITIRASTQVGKTLVLIVILLYLACNRPARAMVVLPDQASATEFRDRVYALARKIAKLRSKIPPTYKWNTRHIDLGGMRIYLAWSGAIQRLRGRACMYVFLSEIDVYKGRGGIGDPVEQANQRVKSFARYLIIRESSPVPDDSRVERLEMASDRRRWWSKCPHCEKWQTVRFFADPHGRGGFGGLKDEHGNYLEPESSRQKVYYVCKTGCVITNSQKTTFMSGGRWLARGQSINEFGQVIGIPERNSREVGVYLWSAHSRYTWGDIAAQYLNARRNGTVPDFYQNWLGMSHRQKGKMPTWQELGTRLAFWNSRGTVPSDAWFLTAGGDVQDGEVYVSVRAWGDQRTSWLIDWFVFEREPNDDGDLVKSDLKKIETAVLSRVFPVVNSDGLPTMNPRGRQLLKVLRLGIDANHRTLDVHNWIKSLGEFSRVIAVRGEAGIKPAEKYKQTTVLESKRAQKDGQHVQYEGGLELMNINPDVFRSDLADRFTSSPGKPGAWYVTKDCLEQGEFYLKQVVNEPKVTIRGKDGRPRVEWKERDPTIQHDFWDCEVYSSSIAQRIVDEMDGQPGWDAAKWPRPKNMTDAQKPAVMLPQVTRDFS